jgi:lysozyme-like predicted toxin
MNKQKAKTKAAAPKAPPAPLTPEQIEKAKKEAEEKAEKQRQQIASDQALLDSYTANLSPQQKDEAFNYLKRVAKGTTMKDGKITLDCPLRTAMKFNCVEADKFTCPNGKVEGGVGCALSPDVLKTLNTGNVRIDGVLVSKAEGGSYLSPYIPWGVYRGTKTIKKDGKKISVPAITPGNSSGVTIGTGVDLGKVDPNTYLRDLEKRGVSKETRDKLQPFLGKTREDACIALRDAKQKLNGQPFILPQKDIDLIDLDATAVRVEPLKKSFDSKVRTRVAGLQGAITAEGKKTVPDQNKIKALQEQVKGARYFDSLSSAQQTVLMSTFYHQGSIDSKPARMLADAFSANDLSLAEQALKEKMKNPEPAVVSRAKRELEYLKSEVQKTTQ